MDIRKQRKSEHINSFKRLHETKENFFDYLFFENESLVDLNFDEINTKLEFASKTLDFPVMINAITGGCEEGYRINRDLSSLAEKYNLGFAVGSQSIALNSGDIDSFEIVRKNNPEGLVISNLSANKVTKEVQLAIEMINADAVQLHLNVPQELAMVEGDREFRDIFSNLKEIKNSIDVPLIIKEVGFGISPNTARKITDGKFEYIDISGKGGTDFIAIEDSRNPNQDFSSLYGWGISTPHSILNVREINKDIFIIASGGIRNSLDVAKAIALGANAVGLSGVILQAYLSDGIEGADVLIKDILYQLKMVMLMTGCRDLEALRKVRILSDSRFKLSEI